MKEEFTFRDETRPYYFTLKCPALTRVLESTTRQWGKEREETKRMFPMKLCNA